MSTKLLPSVGTELAPRTVQAVREEDIRIMALLLRDSNPIHFDLDAVAEAGLGNRVINQGGATMAYVIDYVAECAGGRSAIRTIDCSFRANVFAGDDVVVGAVVRSVEVAGADTLVELEVWADVVGGRRAILGSAQVAWPAEMRTAR